MVGHQAVSKNGGMELNCQFPCPFEVKKLIFFFLKYRLVVISALCDPFLLW
jgi:hypothetical protein